VESSLLENTTIKTDCNILDEQNNFNEDATKIDSFTAESSPSYSPLESLENEEDQILINTSCSPLEDSPIINNIDELKSPIFPINDYNTFSSNDFILNEQDTIKIDRYFGYKILEKCNNYIQLQTNPKERNSITKVELVLGKLKFRADISVFLFLIFFSNTEKHRYLSPPLTLNFLYVLKLRAGTMFMTRKMKK